ncbi:hypothetical protein [Paludisphaera rhizosphaerae]|uniref:hypothetical protein n=1 Tax=Paludisphaera rhizosphaerae TaxID=2711216 RepID=UPI0013EAACD9|nr:hypothetical protein [Paludisphaera rhizosphaerae]
MSTGSPSPLKPDDQTSGELLSKMSAESPSIDPSVAVALSAVVVQLIDAGISAINTYISAEKTAFRSLVITITNHLDKVVYINSCELNNVFATKIPPLIHPGDADTVVVMWEDTKKGSIVTLNFATPKPDMLMAVFKVTYTLVDTSEGWKTQIAGGSHKVQDRRPGALNMEDVAYLSDKSLYVLTTGITHKEGIMHIVIR